MGLWPLDLAALRADPAYPGEEVERTEAWGLVGTWAGPVANVPQPALVLQGHVDVVPAGDLAAWRSTPFEPVLRDGELVGRGSNDMKGGVAAILAAVAAVRAGGAQLTRPYAVHLGIGEGTAGSEPLPRCSAGCPPATARAACPTCWWPRAAAGSGSRRTWSCT